MTEEQGNKGGAARIADRLGAAWQAHFVGRDAEQELFRTALVAATPPFVVLYLFGPGGIGKTTLLHAFARLAAAASRPVVALDARTLEPSPPGVLRALAAQLGAASAELPTLLDAWPADGVLLLDSYEALIPLDPWLREHLFPRLPAHNLVVLAGRTPPDPAWRSDLAWADLMHTIALGNLAPTASRAYLAARGVPAPLHADVLAFTHGHPLALALVADVGRQGALPSPFRPEAAPDVIQVLLTRLIDHVPSPLHQQALEVCGLAWATTESLLAEVVDHAAAPTLFAWLRGLSFIVQGAYGLVPHELVRDAVVADLRWRDPAAHQRLTTRLLAHLAERLARAPAGAQPRLWLDLLALTRQHPAFQTYFDWSSMGAGYAEPAAPADYPLLLAMVQQHEGVAAAQIARYWLQRQPEAFVVFRGGDGTLLGFMAHLTLTAVTPEDGRADPALLVLAPFVAHHGPLRSGEVVRYLRFWMDRGAYQGLSPTLNLVAIHTSITWTTQPRLAWNLIATADPGVHAAHFQSIQIPRVPDADFVVDGRTFGVFARDWRVMTVADWLQGKLTLAEPQTPPVLPAQASAAPRRVVLTQTAFAAAVQQALRAYHSPDALAANPLLQTRLVATTAGQTDPVTVLHDLLTAAVAALQATPRTQKFHRAIWHTYIASAPTQEQAAAQLDLPFNTYRYQLAQGLAHITDWLWQRELGAAPLSGDTSLA